MSITHAELPKVADPIRVVHSEYSVIAWLLRAGMPDYGWAVSYSEHGGDKAAAEASAVQSAKARLQEE